ncbi:hypothetical protein WJX79_003612 [Trebouxia sp. C0005]
MTYLVVANTGLTGTQESGCNAVQDTLLQAIASINKGVSVGCKKPLDHVFKQPQHRLRNSVADVWIRTHRPSTQLRMKVIIIHDAIQVIDKRQR